MIPKPHFNDSWTRKNDMPEPHPYEQAFPVGFKVRIPNRAFLNDFRECRCTSWLAFQGSGSNRAYDRRTDAR